jgi:hypothetical protein
MVPRRNALAIVGALMVGLATTPGQAEVRKLMKMCPERRLCPSFELVLTPPPDWVADAAASEEQKAQVLLPRGRSFHNADAVIYVRVSLKQNDQDLAEFIRVSQQRWRQMVPDSKISKLPAVARANGKPAFDSYRYENPSRRQQGHEVVSFAQDTDNDGNTFVVTAVVSAMQAKALDQALASYRAFLRAH